MSWKKCDMLCLGRMPIFSCHAMQILHMSHCQGHCRLPCRTTRRSHLPLQIPPVASVARCISSSHTSSPTNSTTVAEDGPESNQLEWRFPNTNSTSTRGTARLAGHSLRLNSSLLTASAGLRLHSSTSYIRHQRSALVFVSAVDAG